jgi:two-component system, NarL family, response regulator DevR
MPVTSTGSIRVFLLDDHEIVRRGLAQLIGAQSDMEVVGEAGSLAEALTRAPLVAPAVAVLDVRLPDGSGVEACRELRDRIPGMRALMLTSFADDEALFDAVMAGASGYVLKEIRSGDLIQAIREVAAGRSLLDPATTARVLDRVRRGRPRDERIATLTDQERSVLELIGEGLTNREIGQRMHLSEKTVKNYVTSLLAKLGVHRRTQAAIYITEARQNGTVR